MLVNPYTTGKIVLDPKKFVGRKEVIQNILGTIKNHQMVVIYGQRRIGKSSILSRLRQEISQASGGYIPVFFDLQQHLGEPIDKVLEQLALSIHDSCNLKQTTLQIKKYSIANFKNWLINAIYEIQGSPRKRTINSLIIKRFTELFHLQNPSMERAGIVLLLDELDDIDRDSPINNITAFYNALETILTVGEIKVISVFGHTPSASTKSLEKLLRLSKFIHVGLMSRSEIGDLAKLSSDSLGWSQSAVDEIWQLTQGHPLLAQLLYSDAWSKYSSSNQTDSVSVVSKEDITGSKITNAKEFRHVFAYSWDTLNPEEQVLIRFLASESGRVSPLKIHNWLEKDSKISIFYQSPKPNLTTLLKGLKEKDWLDTDKENDNLYYVKIPLLREYVQAKYEVRQLIEVLYDDQKRANAYYLNAMQLSNNVDALDELEKAIELSPKNDVKKEVVKRFQEIIDKFLEDNENNLVLSYAKRMQKYSPKLAALYLRKAQANIQFQANVQKFYLVVNEIVYTTIAWASNMLFTSPVLIALLSIQLNLFTSDPLFSSSQDNIYPFLSLLLLSGLISVLKTMNVIRYNVFILIICILEVIGLVFVFRTPNVIFEGQYVIAFMIALSIFFVAYPVSDPSFTATIIVLVDLMLPLLGLLVHWDIDLAKLLEGLVSLLKK